MIDFKLILLNKESINTYFSCPYFKKIYVLNRKKVFKMNIKVNKLRLDSIFHYELKFLEKFQ